MRWIVLILSLQLFSCKPIIENAYKVNHETPFKSREDYKNTIAEAFKIKTNNLYYVKEGDFVKLIEWINESKADYFYGIFTNDSLKAKSTVYYQENKSCLGRILKEIESDKSEETSDQLFKKFSFYNVSNGDKGHFKNGNSRTIVLIFGHTQGFLKKKDFIEIQNGFSNNSNYEIFIISVDPVYYYEKK